ncbi:MAG: HesA/MoeB/ThiF family protein [Alphaproteobacteria bacterium]|nr:HesA/MoeB/ThiF family protein [Alphaproteobacteria bacterium]
MSKLNTLRYLRHIDLPGLGFDGQEKICAGTAAIVGMGGLGASAALYLAGAGVKQLILIDHDKVEESNLQRQVIYTESDIGELKVAASAKRLHALNSNVHIQMHNARLDEANAIKILEAADVVLDCTDNFATRFLLNDVCITLKKPLISASVQGFGGQLATFKSHLGNGHACYRCLFPETPPKGMVPSCPEAGVFGPIVGILGVMQAAEALKELAGIGSTQTCLFMLDSQNMAGKSITVEQNPTCPSCSPNGSKQ